MSFNKVLSGSRVLLGSTRAIKKSLGDQPVRTLFPSTPPTVKISFQEKVAMGIILSISCSIIPAWIMYHLREYQGDSS